MHPRKLWAAAAAFAFAAGFAFPLFAQALAPTQAPASVDATAIIDALKDHDWVFLGAFAIYLLVVLVKQGWLGIWLQAHLPRRTIPFVAPVTGVLFLSTTEFLFGHQPWSKALFDGLAAGFLPLIAHATIVDSARGGTELVPAKIHTGNTLPPAALAGVKISSMHPSASEAFRIPPLPPPPKVERRAVSNWAAVLGTVIGVFIAAVVIACTPADRAEIKTVLDFVLSGAQLACVETSSLTTTKEIALACQIDLQAGPGIQSFLDSLLSQKAAARRAGFEWHRAASDAGAGVYVPPPSSQDASHAVVAN